jgi:hypothetical protein
MTRSKFRTFESDVSDYPATLTASTTTDELPTIATVSFRIQDVKTGVVTSKTLKFVDNGDGTATLTLAVAPDSPCNLAFAIQVRFPASNPVESPMKLVFKGANGTTATDKIFPESMPIVFANYVVHFR